MKEKSIFQSFIVLVSGLAVVAGVVFLGSFLFCAPSTQEIDGNNLIFLQAFDRGRLVENLTLSDLEISAGELLLEPEGLTFVKGLKLRRSEGVEIPSAVLPRVIILEVRGYEFHQKLGQMAEQLFLRPYSPSDVFSIVTPVGVYGFSPETLRSRLPEELMKAASTVLKRDLATGGAVFLETFQELNRLIQELQRGGSPRDILRQYRQNLDNLNNFRKFNDQTILLAAERFAKTRAIKHYVVIYQQEFVAIPGAEMMERLLADQSVMFQASELFRSISAEISVEVEPLAEEAKRAGFLVDFIYFKVSPRPRPDMQMRELSTDMFELYSGLARKVGGMVEVTSTPEAQLKRILESTENYYLISCRLPEGVEDPRAIFSNAKVRLRNKNYQLNYFPL
ncbi:MAG: hypothetical protein QME28_10245 [Candidatus Saccharicenans sp.]|nr:hypothetical protein [Candidatus Saccharicenans sp.]